MTRTSTIVTLALLSSVLTPVVVKATGTDKSAPAQQAKVEMAAATTPAAAAEPACARKVKVVYAGYGEAHAAACTTTADLRR
jgi:hypothetical protein